MIKKLDDVMSLHSRAISLREQRQQVLASNIANADTPNYKARDFDFTAALKSAMAGNATASEPATTSSRHLGMKNSGATQAPALYRASVQPSVDGNTVDMDVERAQFADNAVRYEASLNFLSSQIKTLLSAIQG